MIDELDVSGGTPLDRRVGLSRALRMIENGEADVLVVAYLDRLVRSVAIQAAIVERVENAGGGILAVDVGELRTDTASRWLSGTMLGMVAEYARRMTGERTADAKRRAVARGVPPFPNVPPGYRRREDGTLEPDPATAAAVADAFRLRAGGATVAAVRAHLHAHGIERSVHGTQALLASRIVLGELRFGQYVNETSHPALIDTGTWTRVQRMRAPRGRRPKSERLLARLGVLRCASCGGRMVTGTTRQGQKTHAFYRCPSPAGDCPERVTISAPIAEETVEQHTRELLAGLHEHASVDDGVEEARQALDRAEHDLDAAVRAFSGLDDVATARERLHDLRDARDAAHDRLERAAAAVAPSVSLDAGADWTSLTLAGRRDIIRAVVGVANVRPARHGADRISFEPLGQ